MAGTESSLDTLDRIEDRVKITIEEEKELIEDKEEKEAKLEELETELDEIRVDMPSEDSSPAWYDDLDERFAGLSINSDSSESDNEQYYNNYDDYDDDRRDHEYDSNSEGAIENLYDNTYYEAELNEKREEIKELQCNIEKTEQELEDIDTQLKQKDGDFWEQIEKVMDMILKSAQAYNQVDPKLGTTPAIAWEYFAFGFFKQVTCCTQMEVYHCGKKNDHGADVLLFKCTHGRDEIHTVVQVKTR